MQVATNPQDLLAEVVVMRDRAVRTVLSGRGNVSNNKREVQKPPALAPLLLQIQTGVLGNMTTPRAMENTVRTTKKPMKSGAPTLSSLGSGSVLIFLTNTLIQLFYLS